MKIIISKIQITFLLASLYFALPCALADSNSDLAIWNGFFFQKRLSPHFGLYLENQLRLNETESVGSRWILRSGVQYFFNAEMSAMVGYGWLPNFSPFRNENRLWQQFVYQLFPGGGQWVNRLRLEQRWIGNTGSVAHRLRYMMRGLIPLNEEEKKISLCVWDEVFMNLNDVIRGPQAGFDQNRAFLGLNFQMSKEVQIETGYLNLYDKDATERYDLINHTIVLYAYVNW
jgi:hypothetical protein